MKHLQPFLAQFKALHARERVLLVAALIGVLYFLFDIAWIRPQKAQTKALQARLVQQDAELEALNRALRTLTAQRSADPLSAQRAQRDQLVEMTAAAERLIDKANANVRLADTIRRVIAARPGLTLVSLRTLPSETFFQPTVAVATPVPTAGAVPAAAASAPAAPSVAVPTLYRHGIDVVVQGNFLALVPYMQALERETDGIFWSIAKMDVVGYPDVQLKMTIYTLSTRPELPVG